MNPAKKIVVIGAGTMGAGIAQVAAQARYLTCLNDLNDEVLAKAKKYIKSSLDKGIEKGKLNQSQVNSILNILTYDSDLKTACQDADLVIEAIPEKINLKKQLFEKVVSLTHKKCLYATNTSSLSVTDIAQASGAPDRLCGMHFFNPPPILKLLEIVTHFQLANETLSQIKAYAKAMERESIVVKDSPGFASSRLAVATAMEAIRMLEEGVASACDIDTALEVGYRHPMGPLKLTDHIGLDVRLDITNYLYEKLGSETFKPPTLLKKLVSEGKLGRKSGEGFYKWEMGAIAK